MMSRDQVRAMLFKHRRWGEDVSIWDCIKRGAPIQWQLEFLLDDLTAEINAAIKPAKPKPKPEPEKPKAYSRWTSGR